MNIFSAAEEELIKLSEDQGAAERKRDLQFLDQNVTENFLGVSPLGIVLTKEEWFAMMSSPDWEYFDLRLEDKRVRFFGSHVAIVTARQTSSARNRDNLVAGNFRVTEVFVKQNGRWLLANRQLSSIQPT